jgi:hypothetical protein
MLRQDLQSTIYGSILKRIGVPQFLKNRLFEKAKTDPLRSLWKAGNKKSQQELALRKM